MSEEEELESEALNRLSKDQLDIFLSTLIYYVKNPSDPEGLVLSVGNSCELSDQLPNIKEGYTEDMIPKLKDIISLIDQVVPTIKNKVLHDLLVENKQKILDFFTRMDIQPDSYPESDPYGYPKYYPKDAQKYVQDRAKKLVKEITFHPRMDVSEEALNVMKELKESYHNPSRPKDPSPEIDKALTESMARFRERQEESRRIYGEHESPTISLSNADHRQAMDIILRQIAERICKEGV